MRKMGATTRNNNMAKAKWRLCNHNQIPFPVPSHTVGVNLGSGRILIIIDRRKIGTCLITYKPYDFRQVNQSLQASVPEL